MAKKRTRKRPETSAKNKQQEIRSWSFGSGFWQKNWKQAIVLFALAVGLYAMSIPYEFVLDDQIVISKNDFTKKGISGIPEILSTDSFQGYFGEQKDLVVGSRYRPLSLVTFALEYEIFGLSSKAHHLFNVLYYGFLALLMFRVLSILFPNAKYPPWFFTVAFAATLLYVVHPVHTEAVANIKGRDEILSMLGAMASLYAVTRYSAKGSYVWWVLSGVLFFLGLLAKENTITFLAVIPMCYYFFTTHRFRQVAVALIPICVATVGYLILRWSVIGYLLGDTSQVDDLMNNPFIGMSGGERYATIFYTLLLYLKLLVFPHPLTHDYYPYHIPIMHFGQLASLGSLLLYIVMGLFAIWKARSKHILSFCILYFIATLSIVSNLVFPVGTFMNERFLFMPSLAFCIAAGYYLWKLYNQKGNWQRPLALVLFSAMLIGFTGLTLNRVPAWKDPFTLNSAAIKVSKRSARANCFMATALYNKALETQVLDERKRMIFQADSMLDISLAMVPDYYSANQMKSGVVAEIYKYDRDLDKLLAGFKAVLKRKPNITFVNQYMEYLNGRNVDQQKLLDFYYETGFEILANTNRRPDYAINLLKLGYALDPNDARINYAIGMTYINWGKRDEGSPYLARAYALDPSLREQAMQ